MLFNSYLFIFVFLPLALAGVFFLQKKNNNTHIKLFLIVISFAFYAAWKFEYVLLISFSILANYAISVLLVKNKNARTILALGIAFNLILLGYFKYYNFLAININDIFNLDVELKQIALPLAISFFTFQQIAYLVDITRNTAGTRGVLDYVLFVSFFPQLVAGPICRYKELTSQFSNFRLENAHLKEGISLFILGLAKKVLIADQIGIFVDGYYDSGSGLPFDFFNSWYVAIFFTFQIYFDFSGYTDMALGIGRMLNIEFPENFKSPLASHSIIDFWHRWHITLSFFLRDYLYIGLGGNRHGRIRQILNVIITMLLGGLWHGASWAFVLWGLIHGVCLALNHGFRSLKIKFFSHRDSNSKVVDMLAWAITFTCVAFAFVVFRTNDLPMAFDIWQGMAGMNGAQIPIPTFLQPQLSFLQGSGINFGGEFLLFYIKGLLILALFGTLFLPRSKELLSWLLSRRLGAYFLAFALVFSLISMNKVTPFIYFEF